jgi:uncharacterized Tic20 family protein
MQATPLEPYRQNYEPPLTSDETTMAMLAHLLALVGGGFIGPLVILLTKGQQSRFVKFHALGALFFSLLWFGMVIVLFGGVATATVLGAQAQHAASPAQKAGPPIAFFLVFPLMGLSMAIYFLTCIVLAVRAKDGKWSAFPGIGYFVRRMTR